MSNQWQWADRRGLFQRGKEIHEPKSPTERRSSGSGITDVVRKVSVSSNSGLDKTTSNSSTSTDASGPASPTGQRRRSSNTGLFGNLTTMKRGSEDYSQRRESHGDTQNGGMFGGWYNKTFRGMQGQEPAASAAVQSGQQESKRGVME